ncbi:MAG: hypothetical protein KatS3mg030_594 [Saprospiraceae bacterium]|nr:MAG: hypothetical protein KatS3mg030_594 [Saprospiraceae bacterium]
MEALSQFTIPVSGLRLGTHRFEFPVDAVFFSHFPGSPITEGVLSVLLDFDKHSDLWELNFQIQGHVTCICDRCLDEFQLPIQVTQRLLVKFAETEWEDDYVIYLLAGTPQFNVARFIYEFINLAVPMVKTHTHAGESCNPAMLKYIRQEDEEPSTDDEAPGNSSIWDALKGFQFDN